MPAEATPVLPQEASAVRCGTNRPYPNPNPNPYPNPNPNPQPLTLTRYAPPACFGCDVLELLGDHPQAHTHMHGLAVGLGLGLAGCP